MMMAMTSLLSLPDELISNIFVQPFVPNQSLFNLSLCARRLNNICLPYFLSRCHVFLDQPTAQTLIHVNLLHTTPSHQADAIDAINYAKFKIPIKNLHLRFPRPPGSLKHLHRQFNRIRPIFTRLPPLETLQIEFDNYSRGYLANGSDHFLQGWVESFGAMLNAAMVAGCKSLTVSGASYMTTSYELHNSPRKGLSGLGALLNHHPAPIERPGMSGHGWECRRNSQLGQQTYLPQLSAQLKAKTPSIRSIRIETTIFLTPPFSIWILELMTISNITHLTLCDVFLQASYWSIIIPLLATSSPHLSEFSLSRCINMPPSALVGFFTQCTELEVVTLDEHATPSLPFPTPPTTPAPPLPNLKHLTCPSRTAKYFLASRPSTAGGPFRRLTDPSSRISAPTSPLLSKLTIRATDTVIGSRSSFSFSMPELDQCIAPIVARFLRPHYDARCPCTSSEEDDDGAVDDLLRLGKCTLLFPWIELDLPFHALNRHNISSQVAWAAETPTDETEGNSHVGLSMMKFSKKRREEVDKNKRKKRRGNGWEWLCRVRGLRLELKDRLFVLEDDDRREPEAGRGATGQAEHGDGGIGQRRGMFARWLALFPGLERIELLGVVRDDDNRSPGAWEAEGFRRALAGKKNVVILVNGVEV